MARPVRLEFGGALYHVTARGDRREAIYEDDVDRAQFLEVLGQVVGQFNWCCHAYCLMGNHYHLVIATPDGNLSKGMRQLNGVFTQWSNRRHHRTGHLFQGRKPGRRKLSPRAIGFGVTRAPGSPYVDRAAQGLFRHGLEAFAAEGAFLLQVLANGNQLIVADPLFEPFPVCLGPCLPRIAHLNETGVRGHQ